MTQALTLAVIVLAVIVLALVVAVFALARQVGILYERIAPMGALMLDAGPKVGDQAPAFSLPTLDGRTVDIGKAAATSTLLFFLSPTCPVCKKLLPILKSAGAAEKDWLDVVLASDGESTQHLAYYRDQKLSQFPYVLSADLGMTYKVSRLPYAVLLDERGVIRAKGLINNREQLESLFNAKEIGVTSVQEYLQRGAQTGETA